MNDRAIPDEFDTILRDALDDVAAATHPDAGLADMPSPTHARDDLSLPVSPPTAGPGGGRSHCWQSHQSRRSPWGWSSSPRWLPTATSTRDGGTTWQVRTLPESLTSTYDYSSCNNTIDVHGPCVDHVVFANNIDGYLWSANAMYRTTDGGSTWTRDAVPGGRWNGAAQMVVAGDRVVRTTPFRACLSGCADAVQTAPVGTFDWHIATVTRSPYRPAHLSVVGTTVYLFATRTQNAAGPGIFRSSDGGQTWKRVAHDACGRPSRPIYDPFAAV